MCENYAGYSCDHRKYKKTPLPFEGEGTESQTANSNWSHIRVCVWCVYVCVEGLGGEKKIDITALSQLCYA